MTVLGIVLLYHVCAKNGYHWSGAGVAWMIGMVVDAGIVAWGLYCYF